MILKLLVSSFAVEATKLKSDDSIVKQQHGQHLQAL
jgi:hypothetical protein